MRLVHGVGILIAELLEYELDACLVFDGDKLANLTLETRKRVRSLSR